MTLLASLVSAMSNSSKTSNTFTQTLLLGMFLARSVCLTVVRDVCACTLRGAWDTLAHVAQTGKKETREAQMG